MGAKDTAIRHCKISSIDYKTGKMRVTYPDRGDSVSAEIPMISNGCYNMPKVGDTAIVALDGRSGTSGTILGTVWNQQNTPEAYGKENYMRIGMPSAYIDCDLGKVGAQASTITFNSEDTVEIKGGGKVTIKGDTITIEGGGNIEVKAGGSLTLTDSSGSIALSKIIAHCG